MVTQIIGFPPGGGGNRYIRYLQGLEFQVSGISYDLLVKKQSFSCRYLIDDEINIQAKIVLTHCINQTHIRKILGNVDQITILDFSLQDCLRREWILHGRERYARQHRLDPSDLNKKIECYHAIYAAGWPVIETAEDYISLPGHIRSEVDAEFAKVIDLDNKALDMQSAIENIKWHIDYYEKYPLNTKDCNVVTIKDKNIFCDTMTKEFEIFQSEIFDNAWLSINGKR